MKPQIEKVKNARGKIVGYSASIGPITAHSNVSPAEAGEGCAQAVIDCLARVDRGAKIFAWRGVTCIVVPDIEGWRYWHSLMSIGNWCNVSGHREAGIRAALFHAAQNLWTPSEDDRAFLSDLDPFVAKDLQPWIEWQRRYSDARAAGMTDEQAREAAHV